MSVNTLTCNASLRGKGIPFDLEIGEKLRFSTPSARQSFNLLLSNSGSVARGNISAADGRIYVTNKKLAFVTGEKGDFNTFVIEFVHLARIQFSHELRSPWFGPNYWEFMFFSPSDPICDGLPKNECFKGKVVFSDGGIHPFVEVLNAVVNDAVNNPQVDDELPQYSEL